MTRRVAAVALLAAVVTACGAAQPERVGHGAEREVASSVARIEHAGHVTCHRQGITELGSDVWPLYECRLDGQAGWYTWHVSGDWRVERAP